MQSIIKLNFSSPATVRFHIVQFVFLVLQVAFIMQKSKKSKNKVLIIQSDLHTSCNNIN